MKTLNQYAPHAHKVDKFDRYGLAKLDCIERNIIHTPIHPAMDYTQSESWDYKCRKLPNRAGVYIVSCMLFDFDVEELTPLYVGRSGDIRQRFYKHKQLKEDVMNFINHNGTIFIGLILDKLSFKEFDDMEQFLINSLQPNLNKAF